MNGNNRTDTPIGDAVERDLARKRDGLPTWAVLVLVGVALFCVAVVVA